jgi:hypothetical protein
MAFSGAVTLTMSNAELIALREAIAFADFAGDLPGRSAAEIEVLGRFLRTADTLSPEFGNEKVRPRGYASLERNRAGMKRPDQPRSALRC